MPKGIHVTISIVQSLKRKTIIGLGAGLLLLSFLLVIVFTPHFYDSHAGIRQNESAAVGSLIKINGLQSKYAAAHPKQGFACQLQQLRVANGMSTIDEPTTALLSGAWSGYNFVLLGCTPAANGIVNRYRITAIPSVRSTTGMRAFCTDESGNLFYEENGSGTKCLSSRLPVFK